MATYEPEPDGWTARVRLVQISGHTYHRVHTTVIDPSGHAAHTCFATMISEGWRIAEGNVDGRNGTRCMRLVDLTCRHS
jgi:hypothetical protein